MKKILFLLVMFAAFVACSKDDDKNDSVVLTDDVLVGKWNVTAYSSAKDFTDVPKDYIYIEVKEGKKYSVKFLSNTYIGTYKIDENVMVGETIDEITERFEFVSLKNNVAEINYSNSEGDLYKFKASKEK